MADEATEAAGGTTEQPKTEAPKQAAKIVVAGKEYTPEQLEKTITESSNQATAFRDATAALFDMSKTPAERQQAATKVFKDIGYSDTAIQEWVRANVSQNNEEGTEKRETPKQEGDSETLKELRAIQNERLNEAFKVSTASLLEKSGEVANLIKATERLRGKEEAAKVKQGVEKHLGRQAMDNIKARIARTNERLTPEIVREEVNRALPEITGLFSAAIADPSSLGRGAETSTTTGPQPKKVPPPKFKEGMTSADVEKQATEFFTYELVEAANQAANHSDSMV